MPQLKKRERIHPFFTCCFVWALNGQMMPTHTGEGRPSLFNLLVQMLISPVNTLTDILKNNVLLAIWAPLSPVTLTYKINHHRFYFLTSSVMVL